MRWLLVVSLLALAACTSGGATGAKYKGDPLFTVHGQIAATTSIPEGPFRLAVAWYTDQTSVSAPSAVVTQDIEYQGSFPLEYAFSFYDVPPQNVLRDTITPDGGTIRSAYGVLLAYQDLNGNRALDIIGKDQSPIDHILGTSEGDFYNGNPVATPMLIAYFEGPIPELWHGHAGYNLWQQGNQLMPDDTRVLLQLDGSNELDFFVCAEFIDGLGTGYDLPCHIPPTGGMRVLSSASISSYGTYVSASLVDGTAPIVDATVEFNGQPLSFDAPSGYYFLANSDAGLAPGMNRLTVTRAGFEPRVLLSAAPAIPSILQPQPTVRLASDAPVQIEWAPADAAQTYVVALNANDGGTSPQWLYPTGRESHFMTTVDWPGVAPTQWVEASVAAYAEKETNWSLGGSSFTVLTQAAVDFLFIAPDAGLSVGGQLVHVIDHQNGIYDSIFLDAYDGLAEFSVADVRVNDQPLHYDHRYNLFTAQAVEALTPSMPAVISVQAGSRPAFSTTIALPGVFDINDAGTSWPVGGQTPISWSPSAGAQGYQLGIIDETGAYRSVVSLPADATSALIGPLPADAGEDLWVGLSAYIANDLLQSEVEVLYPIHATN